MQGVPRAPSQGKPSLASNLSRLATLRSNRDGKRKRYSFGSAKAMWPWEGVKFILVPVSQAVDGWSRWRRQETGSSSEHEGSRPRLELIFDSSWIIGVIDNYQFGNAWWIRTGGSSKVATSLRTASDLWLSLSSWHSSGAESPSELRSNYVYLTRKRSILVYYAQLPLINVNVNKRWLCYPAPFDTSCGTQRERCRRATSKRVA